jgi:hypothetical protein
MVGGFFAGGVVELLQAKPVIKPNNIKTTARHTILFIECPLPN